MRRSASRTIVLLFASCLLAWFAPPVAASGIDCTPWQVHGFHMEMSIEAARESAERQRFVIEDPEASADEAPPEVPEGTALGRILAVRDRKERFIGSLLFDPDGRLVSYLVDFPVTRKKSREVVDRFLYNLFVERFGEPDDKTSDPYVAAWPEQWAETYGGQPHEVKTWHSTQCDAHLALAEGRIPGYTQIYTFIHLQRITYLELPAVPMPEPQAE